MTKIRNWWKRLLCINLIDNQFEIDRSYSHFRCRPPNQTNGTPPPRPHNNSNKCFTMCGHYIGISPSTTTKTNYSYQDEFKSNSKPYYIHICSTTIDCTIHIDIDIAIIILGFLSHWTTFLLKHIDQLRLFFAVFYIIIIIIIVDLV